MVLRVLAMQRCVIVTCPGNEATTIDVTSDTVLLATGHPQSRPCPAVVCGAPVPPISVNPIYHNIQYFSYYLSLSHVETFHVSDS